MDAFLCFEDTPNLGHFRCHFLKDILGPVWTAIFCRKIASFSVTTFSYTTNRYSNFLQKIQENAIQTRPLIEIRGHIILLWEVSEISKN